MYTLLSPYGEKLDTSPPLQDYPRPQLVRESYLNLNGRWQYAITKADTQPEAMEGDILVPFSPESPLSGVQHILQPNETLWYKRTVVFPQGFLKKRALLHFGGVDQCCIVFWNGREVARHTGGYLPFSCDVTNELCSGENLLFVKVVDETCEGPYMRGRQSLLPKSGWRPPFSGIWQTVWMESLPEVYVSAYRVTPLYDEQAVEIQVDASEEGAGGELSVLALASEVARRPFTAGEPLRVELPGALSWNPRNPFLYTLAIELEEDRAKGYFAMRKFSLKPDGSGHLRFCLNNQTLLLRGVLDEGFFSDGYYTPPSGKAMRDDILFAKQCGFNLIRKYGKVEPSLWYYQCDKAGMLVWQDLPGGGEDPKASLWDKYTGGRVKDNKYRRFGRENAQSRSLFLRDGEAIAEQLYGWASLCAYTLFDEGYGQFDAVELAKLMKSWDPTRLVDHAGGRFDQGAGDFLSLHCLEGTPPAFTTEDTRAFALSACGGFGLPAPPAFSNITPEAPQMLATGQELEEALETLWGALAALEKEGLAAFCYYRLSDAGNDVSGLMSGNRRKQRVDPKFLSALNRQFST